MNRYIPHLPIVSASVARVTGGLLRQFAGIRRALAYRQEVRSLAELDDRTLRDIGLSRADIGDALARPLFRDPSLVSVRTMERRIQLQVTSPELKRQRPVVQLVKGARCA